MMRKQADVRGALTNLDGLSTLRDVSQSIFIEGNAALVDVGGLEGLMSLRALAISDNAMLCQDDAVALGDTLALSIEDLRVLIGANAGVCQ